jgi:hypothetical protein
MDNQTSQPHENVALHEDKDDKVDCFHKHFLFTMILNTYAYSFLMTEQRAHNFANLFHPSHIRAGFTLKP